MGKRNNILAIDIGAGTQDILIFDPGKTMEGMISLVLPSPTLFFGERIKRCKDDIFFEGDTIGGGGITSVLKRHIKSGHRVIMTRGAAFSVRDNLEEVEALGIEIGEIPEDFKGNRFRLREVDIELLRKFLNNFEEDFNIGVVALAVQDHGTPPLNTSARKFRFSNFESLLKKRRTPLNFAYWEDEIPQQYKRMRSACQAAKEQLPQARCLLMDTSFSAIVGCMEEDGKPSLLVNVGNNHTLAVLLAKGKIDGLMELHTLSLTPEDLRDQIEKFVRGTITNDEVFERGGHGAVIFTQHFLKELSIKVTGPHREIFRETGLPFEFSAPYGNMMMTGPIGLIRAVQVKLGQTCYSKRSENSL
jgi:uncharacterized protein (DUF1786 family)